MQTFTEPLRMGNIDLRTTRRSWGQEGCQAIGYLDPCWWRQPLRSSRRIPPSFRNPAAIRGIVSLDGRVIHPCSERSALPRLVAPLCCAGSSRHDWHLATSRGSSPVCLAPCRQARKSALWYHTLPSNRARICAIQCNLVQSKRGFRMMAPSCICDCLACGLIQRCRPYADAMPPSS